jgi:hypothetical protein
MGQLPPNKNEQQPAESSPADSPRKLSAECPFSVSGLSPAML